MWLFLYNNIVEFLPSIINDYTKNHTEKESKLLANLNRETWKNVMMPRMLSGHLQGRILSMFSKILSPSNILEIGTYTGYSGICLAEGLKNNGILHTIDINEEYSSVARRYFNNSKYKNQIKQYIGNAIDIIPKLSCSFQLVYIDADKKNYCNYFDSVINNVDLGGLIIADNVLWSGKVTESFKDNDTKSIDQGRSSITELKAINIAITETGIAIHFRCFLLSYRLIALIQS